MHSVPGLRYPLPISRALQAAADNSVLSPQSSVLALADALTCYLGAVAVGHYSRALFMGEAAPDPTLNRSLRSLRRVLPGQWLLWAARGLAAAPDGAVEGLASWYAGRVEGPLAISYAAILRVMTGGLGYTGEYGARGQVSPRDLLELIDQYRIRASKAALSADDAGVVHEAIVSGVRAAAESAAFLTEYDLYAPAERKLLMGLEPKTPMPPLSVPPGTDEVATLLLFPPGEMPDYTKRPRLGDERQPLFPLDPLLVYLPCDTCGTHRIGALREVVEGAPQYVGLDVECGHIVRVASNGT